ncbi:MAG TPA: alkaline phosphatase family protein, partial [Kineosporiaceae bacterium]|nr:alkaline phosphatase family protein [Kineosporiaceae bacterium]
MSEDQAVSRWRATGGDVRDALIGLLPTTIALLIASALLPGFDIGPWWNAGLVALAIAVADAVLRPPLRLLAGRAGAVAALVLGIATQIALVELALLIVPGVSATSLNDVIVTLLIVAVVTTATRWALGVSDSSYLVGDLIRRAKARRRRAGGAPWPAPAEGFPPGVVVVQIDGLPFPVLQHGVVSGILPTLSRWVRSGSHDATRWWARVPSTTPASQAALLHGTNEGIPAFRWYEKDTGRLMVANRPADAAVIEARISDGRGLLAGGGVSISNMFTGDAETSLMVMSRAVGRGGLGPGGDYVRFFASPFVFARALVRTVGEMIKELYQGRQQRLRGIEPRIRRHGSYVALRGVTNALLRDLNVALVAEHMVRGAPVIFVDFVDYDEIAHHAGIARPEALDALAGLDGVLATLEAVAPAAPRDYRFVVLSDHGQSQGATFLQLSGRSLEEVVRSFTGADTAGTVADTSDVEAWGPLNAMLADVLGATGRTARWAEHRSRGSGVVVGPHRGRPTRAPPGRSGPRATRGRTPTAPRWSSSDPETSGWCGSRGCRAMSPSRRCATAGWSDTAPGPSPGGHREADLVGPLDGPRRGRRCPAARRPVVAPAHGCVASCRPAAADRGHRRGHARRRPDLAPAPRPLRPGDAAGSRGPGRRRAARGSSLVGTARGR